MSGPKLERVGTRDPNRCQQSNGNVACQYKSIPGSQFCPLHGGSATARSTEKRQLRNLILQGEMGQRAGEMLNTGRLKDLTDEVILARVMLEGLAKNIKSPTDYMIYSDKINSTLKTVQSLTETLQKIQEKNRELVDRATLFAIAEGILAVIAHHVTDPDSQVAIGREIYDVIIKGLGGEVPGQSYETEHHHCKPLGM
jgi:hypothetical protein